MFRGFRHFTSIEDVFVFFHIIILWFILPLLLLFPLERALQFLTPSRRASGSVPPQKILLFINWCNQGHIGIRGSCLKKSLLLYYMLNRHGIPAKLCIGVKKEDGALTGHSWIEGEEGVIGEKRSVDEFIVMYTYPKSKVEG